MIDDFSLPTLSSFSGARAGWLVEQYLSACKGRISAPSAQKYGHKLNHFTRWASGYPAIDQARMAEFAEYLKKQPNINLRTAREVVQRTGQCLRWAYRNGYSRADYSAWLPTIKAPKRVFKPVTPANVQALLAACEKKRYATRNKALIAIMAGGGLRLEETTAVCMDDLAFDDDHLLTIIVKEGKGGKSRTTVLARAWAGLVRCWCAELAWTPGPLFVSQKSCEPLTPRGLENEFAKLAQLAGVEASPHDLRRFFATQWAKKYPAYLDLLRRMMGHSDLAITSSYILALGQNEDIKQLLRNDAL